MGYLVGIDLGTTNSVLAYTELGRQRCHKLEKAGLSATFPSCIYVDTKGKLAFGQRARRNPESVREFKRGIGTGLTYVLGDQSFTAVDLSALLLSKMKLEFQNEIGEIEGVIITVPANFNDKKRTETREAGIRAGLNVLRVINEPSAAAIAYALSEHKPAENSLVIDWGGGTLDVSLLDRVGDLLDVKANDGDERCGGKDIDALVYQAVSERNMDTLGAILDDSIARNELLMKCEEVKIRLSEEDVWDDVLPIKSHRKYLEFVLHRSELEEMMAPIVGRVLAAVDRCLAKCPEGALSPRDISDVMLVGGSCYIPLLQRRVEEHFGKKGRMTLNPMEVVALGAAYQANHTEATGALITVHSLTKSLGVSCIGADGKGVLRPNMFDAILPATTKLPAEGVKTYYTVHDNQKSIDVSVYENDDDRETVDGLTPWSDRSLDGLPAEPASSYPIHIKFNYTVDQILTVEVSVPDHDISEVWQADHVSDLEAERDSSLRNLEQIQSGTIEAFRTYLERVESAVASHSSNPQVSGMVDRLRTAVSAGQVQEAREIKRDLSRVMFDLGIHL